MSEAPDPQEQFLQVIDRDEAERRFLAAIHCQPQREEEIALSDALGRVLAADVVSTVDVPSFDRSNVDGYAVISSDTYGATEEQPRSLKLSPEVVATAVVPQTTVTPGTAVVIATGGMVPRGADAIVMVEHADLVGDDLAVRNSVAPGQGIAFAGTDMTRGEVVLRRGQRLASRETGVLAAVGHDRVVVHAVPRVAILSTGDEIIAPGETMRPGFVFDSNARILADTVKEVGGEPVAYGIVGDDRSALRDHLVRALADCDVVVLSGGTSKGAGDLCYQVVAELTEPGIVAHGVALKPGKPICLAAHHRKPVVILPGFPTSAIFTFHEFVAPVIGRMAGLGVAPRSRCVATLATKVLSDVGRQEYLLVGLIPRDVERCSADLPPPDSPRPDRNKGPYADHPSHVEPSGNRLAAYPMGKGSGSVTTFSRADGFVVIDRHQEIVPAGAKVEVQLLGNTVRPADLIVIGSHCVLLDRLIGEVQRAGFVTKFLAVGSWGGLEAAKRGECDVAGIHLLHAETGEYNHPYVTPDLECVPGYRRRQGVVFRPGDSRFPFESGDEALLHLRGDADLRMVNRNAGSGTRVLIDLHLEGATPPGYPVQPRSHQAVAAAVLQRRADWGVTIEWVAAAVGLRFLPLADEAFDFVIPRGRRARPAVRCLIDLLRDREQLARLSESLSIL